MASCPLCGRSTPQDFCRDCAWDLGHCPIEHPLETWTGPLPYFAWGYYQTPDTDGLKRAIAALKYDNNPGLARCLGQWVGQTWRQQRPPLPPGQSKPLVVPIPLHPSKLKQRGFNQADLLARSFCQVTGFPYEATGLMRTRSTQAQFGLTPQARQANVQAAFAPSPGLRRRSPPGVLIFDDIYTTGSTVRSAAQCLQDHKIPVLGVVVLARVGTRTPTA
ncbi:hypothetical protein PROH_16215 [Prochlorothrix hollandica PCC 9006 = CALU 1027]|uniref:ComF family protein n=2 Tax=Prochlorothrix hollandica TaxID=1223 RepID=A0A0M2PWE2_PROHO|nr:hypothetical protein PROH_16215 [Prochlorothrix hollandica PCC 9006 = CALU 1027]